MHRYQGEHQRLIPLCQLEALLSKSTATHNCQQVLFSCYLCWQRGTTHTRPWHAMLLYAGNVVLPTLARGMPCCCVPVQRSIDISCRPHCGLCWDRQTEARQMHIPCSAYHVSSANNWLLGWYQCHENWLQCYFSLGTNVSEQYKWSNVASLTIKKRWVKCVIYHSSRQCSELPSVL